MTSHIKRGDWIRLSNISGPVPVRQCRKRRWCSGWAQQGKHYIEPGTLYVETEPNETAGGYGMSISCLEHALEKETA